jgi:hypothetical protein
MAFKLSLIRPKKVSVDAIKSTAPPARDIESKKVDLAVG